MFEIVKNIFLSDLGSGLNNSAMLAFRFLLALELFRVHGMKKFRVVNGAREQVPNPLHLPDGLNKTIAAFSDTIVPFLVMAGLGTRFCVLPTIGVTAIGYFVVHRKDNAEVRDVPYMYTLCLLFIMIVGAGKYSVDTLIFENYLN